MWIKFEKSLLKTSLAIDECIALDNVQTFEVDKILSQTCHFTASTFRQWIGRYYRIDSREDYIPESYVQFALDFARYNLWTRLPNSGQIALDDRRVKTYDNIMQMLGKKPPFTPEDPEDEPGPGTHDPVVIVPSWIDRYE